MTYFQYQGAYFALKKRKRKVEINFFTWRSVQLLFNTAFSLNFAIWNVTHSKSLPLQVPKILFICSNLNYKPHLKYDYFCHLADKQQLESSVLSVGY